MNRRLAFSLSVLGLLAGGCHSAPPAPTGYLPHSQASALPTAEVGGVRVPHLDPGPNPGMVQGTLPKGPKGRSPQSAVVEIRDQYGQLVGRARANRSGSFNVNLPPGAYTFSSIVPGYKHAVTAKVQVQGGQSDTIEFTHPTPNT